MAEESVADALRRELEVYDAALAGSALAMSALALARELDTPTSATSKANCARELRETLARLRELAPPLEEGDRIDDLSSRRAKRRSA